LPAILHAVEQISSMVWRGLKVPVSPFSQELAVPESGCMVGGIARGQRRYRRASLAAAGSRAVHRRPVGLPERDEHVNMVSMAKYRSLGWRGTSTGDRRGAAQAQVRGFTLVELLLAVILVGVLATIASASYGNYANKARSAQAATDIVAMSAIIQHYALENNYSYPLSLADVGYAGKTDPWGRPYVYYNIDHFGKGGSRKDHALNPLNTDFDLYSVGPDGKTKRQITQKDSLDDILRAGNGSFVGVAADF
jgi:general secretion pathway protein G